SSRFRELSQAYRQVAHVLLTHPPLVPPVVTPKGSVRLPALDLHVLGTPPAFVLSQDQTLHKSKSLYKIRFRIYLANFRQVKKLFFRKQLLIYYRCVVQFSRNVFINLLVTTATNIS